MYNNACNLHYSIGCSFSSICYLTLKVGYTNILMTTNFLATSVSDGHRFFCGGEEYYKINILFKFGTTKLISPFPLSFQFRTMPRIPQQLYLQKSKYLEGTVSLSLSNPHNSKLIEVSMSSILLPFLYCFSVTNFSFRV